MIIKIAICDDDSYYIDELKTILTNYQFSTNNDIITTVFLDGKALLDSYEEGNYFDIVLLDIEMKFSNGIEIAKEIKKHFYSPYLIFVSNYPQYMANSFDAHPYYFINKPVTQEKINKLFDEILNDINESNNHIIIVNTDTYSRTIDIRNIYSIETISTRKNYCLLKTNNEELEIKGLITEWNDLLSSYGFIQCHRGYIINLRHVHYIDKNNIIMKNATSIPLSRSGKKLINTKFL